MRKWNLIAGCVLALVVAPALWLVRVGPQSTDEQLYADLAHWLDDTALKDQELSARRVALRRFIQIAGETEDAVFGGRLALRDAVARILAASREHDPTYLDSLARLEEGATDEERIARNIIRHFEEDERLQQDESLRQRLQTQLAEMFQQHR
jgi:hypothetical protein